jgi:hypothetical protein
MRKFFAAAVVSVVALVGFAGAAYASATVDLIWRDTGVGFIWTDGHELTFGDADTSVIVTYDVVLTAGPNGIAIAALSMGYADAAVLVSVSGFGCVAGTALNICIGDATDTGSAIESMGIGTFNAVGLTDGQSQSMGTVSFRKKTDAVGIFPLTVGELTGIDAIFDNVGGQVTGVTYNTSILVNLPEPGVIAVLAMGMGGMLLAGRGRRS